MAIKKIRIRPEGGNSYADILHPETSIDMVVGLQTSLDSKVDKSGTKVLSDTNFTQAEKDKLAGITASATKVENSPTNGNIKINGAEQIVYTHPTGTNPHGTTKSDVGLGSVENKSSATIRGEITSANVTTALGYTPLNSNLKGANSGLAELDSTGKVPSSQLPSYVDDVLEYATKAGFPATGETGKIYIDLATNLTFRWSGSAYVEISPSLALGETSSTAYRGDRGKIAYDHSQATHARTDATLVQNSSTNGNIKINGAEQVVYTHPAGTNPHGTTKADVGLGNVSNALQATKTEFDTHVTDFNNKYGLLTNIVTTTGTSTAYLATVPNYVAGKQFPLKFHLASGSSPTLNVNSTGAKAINKAGGSPANFKAGIYNLIYDGTSFQLLGEGGEYGTAQAQDVLIGKTIGTDDGLVTGTMSDQSGKTLTNTSSTYALDPTESQFGSNANGGYGLHRHKVAPSHVGKIDENTVFEYIAYGYNPDVIKAGQVIGTYNSPIKGTFTADATAIASEILSGKTVYVNGNKLTGTMTNNGTVNQSLAINGSYTIPQGYHSGTGKVTQSITTLGATSYTPGTTTQTISAGQYLTGAQTIQPVANLSAGNVAQGVIVGGVTGTYKGLGNAVAGDVLSGKTFSTAGLSNATGTMANNGAVNGSITTQSGTYTVPAGYHSGTGTVTANITNLTAENVKSAINVGGVVGTFTSDANAVAGNILYGKTAYVNGNKLTGTMYSNTPGTTTLTTQGERYYIPEGYHYGAGDVRTNITNLVAGNVKSGVKVGGVDGTFTSDANATASDIVSGKTAYVNGNKVTGTNTKQYGAGDVIPLYNTCDIPLPYVSAGYHPVSIYKNRASFGGGLYNISDLYNVTLITEILSGASTSVGISENFAQTGDGTTLRILNVNTGASIRTITLDGTAQSICSDNSNVYVCIYTTAYHLVKYSADGLTKGWTTKITGTDTVTSLYTTDSLQFIYFIHGGFLRRINKSTGIMTSIDLTSQVSVNYGVYLVHVNEVTLEACIINSGSGSSPRLIKVKGDFSGIHFNTSPNVYGHRAYARYNGEMYLIYNYTTTGTYPMCEVVYVDTITGTVISSRRSYIESPLNHQMTTPRYDPSDPYTLIGNRFRDSYNFPTIIKSAIKL